MNSDLLNLFKTFIRETFWAEEKSSAPKKYRHTTTDLHSKKIAEAVVAQSHTLSKQEADAFRMKAITLLRDNGIHFPTVSDQLQTIQRSPIIAKADPSFVSVFQSISTFPGETIELKGTFKRELKSKYSIPVADSFKLSQQSHQTGFPHPSQHNGWALSERLIAKEPVPGLEALLQKKKQLAEDLSRCGPILTKAKGLLKQKRSTFESDKKRFIELHRQLALAIFNSAPVHVQTNKETIGSFFDDLHDVHSPYDHLSEVYYKLPDNNPFAVTLKSLWNVSFHHIETQADYPRLSPFEQKLQAAAYKQLQEFLEPISLQEQLETDIALFENDTLPDVVKQIEQFYT